MKIKRLQNLKTNNKNKFNKFQKPVKRGRHRKQRALSKDQVDSELGYCITEEDEDEYEDEYDDDDDCAMHFRAL